MCHTLKTRFENRHLIIALPLFLFVLTACNQELDEHTAGEQPSEDLTFDPGTEEDREALFYHLVELTMERDAFASLTEHPVHREHPAGIDVVAEMEEHKDDLIEADNAKDMWLALWKMSNIRKDRHLRVYETDNGLEVPEELQQDLRAPIRFRTDYSDPDERFLFVRDLGVDIEEHVDEVPEPGDRLMSINGTDATEYIESYRIWHHASMEDPYWWEVAGEITRTRDRVPHSKFYDEDMEVLALGLQRQDGTTYEIELPYFERGSIEWQGIDEREYPGFSNVPELEGEYNAFRNFYVSDDPDVPVVILDWARFDRDLLEGMETLMDYAEENNLLDHHVIVDATRAGGGSNGAFVLARLQSEKFRTTGHNMMVSDLSESWIRNRLERWQDNPPEHRPGQNPVYEKEWAESEAIPAFENDNYYTRTVPFKGVQPVWGDRFINPADRHFTGGLTVWLNPQGGSHLDQFASQVVDNNIGHLMGMPTGGFSNSWQTSETLRFPTNDKPIVDYQWSMGHSIRPNDEILQYNPAQPHEYVPVTRDNYFDYHPMMLERTLERIGY